MLGAVAARLPRVSILPRRGQARTSIPAADTVSVPREVLKFIAGGLVAALLVGGGSFWAVSRAATAEAINSAQLVTQLDADSVVQPVLSAGVVHGNTGALAALDSVVRSRVLSSRVVRVKIWTGAGRIVYSDMASLIGQTYPLGDDEEAAFDSGTTASDDSDLSKPENRFERGFGSLLEVYLPVRASDGTKLLFETYQRDAAIQADRNRVWLGLLPTLIAGLSAFFILQIPLAWRLARRLERSGRERAALLQRAIESSERERRRVAGDLHDGPVQRLTGVSLSLGTMAARLSSPGGALEVREVAGAVRGAADDARTAIRELRSLMIEIAPPDLDSGGLRDAMERLVAGVRESGVRADVHMPERLDLPPDVTSLVYRVAQESLRNVIKHAAAKAVTLTLTRNHHSLTLYIADDGRGFDASTLQHRRGEGHVGLALLDERVAESGGVLRVHSQPGSGTTVHMRIDNV